MAEYAVKVLTGVRPTGDLTVANYLGAVKPILELQADGMRPFLFVADLHALTDKEPEIARTYVYEVVADYLALGIDPKKTTMYTQSSMSGLVFSLMGYLARHATVAELLRIPTLKDKLKDTENPENANSLLMMYPILMAADILIQRSEYVPTGEDQLPHIEMTRLLARRFNKKYKEVFALPKAMKKESLRILSLRGDGKMSKSSPEGALFLTDDAKTIEKKLRRAQTAVEGEMNAVLLSHIQIAKGLAKDPADIAAVDVLLGAHKKGEAVMGDFKNLMIKIVQEFLGEFQQRRAEITADPDYIPSVLEKGNKKARKNAEATLTLVEDALFG